MEDSETWQNLKPRDRMTHLLNTGHLSDCSFVVCDEDGQKIDIKCHKFVLMSASPVLERMFSGDFEECSIPDNIVLDDVSASDFRKFIKYLYGQDSRQLHTYSLETLRTLIYMSKKFMVPCMTSSCLDSLRRRLPELSPDETIYLYEYAHQMENHSLILDIQSGFLVQSKRYLYSPAIHELSFDVFLKFIKFFKGFSSEMSRFCLIERYCKKHALKLEESKNSDGEAIMEEKHDPFDLKGISLSIKAERQNNDEAKEQQEARATMKKPQEFIQKLLESIQFTSMSAYEFCSGPGVSNLMSVDQKYEILSHICIEKVP